MTDRAALTARPLRELLAEIDAALEAHRAELAAIDREGVAGSLRRKLIEQSEAAHFAHAPEWLAALRAAVAPLVETEAELGPLLDHAMFPYMVEDDISLREALDRRKQLVLDAAVQRERAAEQRGRNAGIEEAAKAVCERCARGMPLVDGYHYVSAEQAEEGGGFPCPAEPIRALRREGDSLRSAAPEEPR